MGMSMPMPKGSSELEQAAEQEAAGECSWRRDFPIFNQPYRDGIPLTYLDSAATTQKPQVVIDALSDFYSHTYATVHRGAYELSSQVTDRFDQVRAKLAQFLGAPDERAIVFTRNATEAINLVAYAWGLDNLSPGDNVVLTIMEHHSNIIPWQLMAHYRGIELRYVEIDQQGELKLDQLAELIDEHTRLVGVTHVSNVLGTVNPLPEIGRLVRECSDALILFDGAQAAPHLPVNLTELEFDFYVLSAHKMLGPTGIGALISRSELLEKMQPFNGGGSMIERVELDTATWAELPYKFEAGTPHIAGVIGWGAALDYLTQVGMERVLDHELALTDYALARLSQVPGIRIFGQGQKMRLGVISFELAGIHPHDIATILDHHGVCIRAGHHCAQLLMKFLGVPATSRASFYLYNGRDDVDRLVNALMEAVEIFR